MTDSSRIPLPARFLRTRTGAAGEAGADRRIDDLPRHRLFRRAPPAGSRQRRWRADRDPAAPFSRAARHLRGPERGATGCRRATPRGDALAAGPLHAAAGRRHRPAVRAAQLRCRLPLLGTGTRALAGARPQRSASRALARLAGVPDRGYERLVPARSVFAQRVALLDGIQRFPDRQRRRSLRRRQARQPAVGRRLPRRGHRRSRLSISTTANRRDARP